MAEKEKIEEVVEEPLNGRAKMVEYLRAETPDAEVDYDDDDAFFGALDSSIASKDEMIGKYKSNSESLSNLMNNNPEVGAFIADIADGMSIDEAIGANFGDIIGDDEEAKERYKKGIESHKNRFAEIEKIQQLQKENVEKYKNVVEEFVANLPEEERESFPKFVGEWADKVYMFDFSDDLLDRFYKAFKYDADVQEAEEFGEVKGRNEKIELKKKDVTDGLPQIGNSRNTPKETKQAFSFSKRESIWDKE